jgi:hypothetical protein
LKKVKGNQMRKFILALPLLVFACGSPAYAESNDNEIIIDNTPNAQPSEPSVTVPLQTQTYNYKENLTVTCSSNSNALFAWLKETYTEIPIIRGAFGSTGIMSYWINYKTGTWTVVVTNNQGHACIIASGDKAQMVKMSETPAPGEET